MRRLLLCSSVAFLHLLLSACEGFFGDDDEGDRFVMVTADGSVQMLSGNDVQASMLWDGEIAAAERAELVADGDALYVGSGQELMAFSQSSGAPLWSAPVTLSGPVVALAGPGSGALFAMTLDGSLVALEVADGSLRWSLDLLIELPGSSDDALLFAGGSLVLGGDPIRAISAEDGSVLASYSSGDSYVSDLAAVGNQVFAGLADRVVALALPQLSEVWSHPTSDEVDNLVVGGAAVFYSVLGAGVGLLTTSGNPVASADDDGVYEALAMGPDNLLLGARSDAVLLAWDETALEEQWTVTDVSVPVQGLASAGTSVFYGNGGYVDGISAVNGNSLWVYQASGAAAGLLGI